MKTRFYPQQNLFDILLKTIDVFFEYFLKTVEPVNYLPRWLSWLRHSAHRPGQSVGGAGVQFPGSAGRFRVQISGAHALRLISRAGKEGTTVSSIICDRWLILS